MRRALVGFALAAALAAFTFGSGSAAELPDYLKPISGTPQSPSAEELATENVLQLNTTMFSLYDNAGKVFRENILAKHPVILALFAGTGSMTGSC